MGNSEIQYKVDGITPKRRNHPGPRRMSASVRKMNLTEIFWFAGLFEGEGSIFIPNPKTQNSPRMTIAMNDLDIIERVRDITGVGNILRDKKMHRWQVNRTNDVLHLLCSIVPILGERRRSQVTNVLNKIGA